MKEQVYEIKYNEHYGSREIASKYKTQLSFVKYCGGLFLIFFSDICDIYFIYFSFKLKINLILLINKLKLTDERNENKTKLY